MLDIGFLVDIFFLLALCIHLVNCLLASKISDQKSACNLIDVSLYGMVHFSFAALMIL